RRAPDHPAGTRGAAVGHGPGTCAESAGMIVSAQPRRRDAAALGARAAGARRFIAHPGVHLGGTIAGENSLEAVNLARRAGFACIETDVRLSADGELIIMHDETLNRTATDASGGELGAPALVSDVPFARLRADYRLKARD